VPAPISQNEFNSIIRKAWTNGRPIIPIIGAGASANSGFPPIASVVRYIAKLACYLKYGLYLPTPEARNLFRKQIGEFATRIDKFISIFGWPDRFQLNADLRGRLDHLHDDPRFPDDWQAAGKRNLPSALPKLKRSELTSFRDRLSTKGKMDYVLGRTLDDLARDINPGGFTTLDRYLARVYRVQRSLSWLTSIDKASPFSQVVTAYGSEELLTRTRANGRDLEHLLITLSEDARQISRILKSHLDDREENAGQHISLGAQELAALRETAADLEPILTGTQQYLAIPPNLLSFRYQVAADWKPLLRYASWYQPALIDALFARLARNRTPNTSHVFLAHLAQLLRIRVLFTFNFDPFIETAFANESVAHRVFAMEHGDELPSRHHLDDTVSLIKMHGSTHNILVDEKVDYRVSNTYRKQFLDLIGEKPLLLVMGCSGNDRRLVDLVGDLMADVKHASTIWTYHKSYDDTPPSLISLPSVSRFGSYDFGQTLRLLFESLTNRLPNSNTPYVAHVNRPVIPDPTRQPNDPPAYNVHERPVTIFSSLLPHSERQVEGAGGFPVASRRFMHALAEVPLGYTVITLDLEEHHSLEQVVADIIDQVRRGDSLIPPFLATGPILGAAGEDYAFSAADRVLFALRRSRYALCIRGIDAFSFKTTTHHGVTSKLEFDEERLYRLLILFLTRLAEGIGNRRDWSLGDSFLILTYEKPYCRHFHSASENERLKKVTEILDGFQKALTDKGYPIDFVGGSAQRAIVEPSNKVSEGPTFFLPKEFRAHRGSPVSTSISIWHVVMAAIVMHRRTRTNTGIHKLIADLEESQLANRSRHVTGLDVQENDRQGEPFDEEPVLAIDAPTGEWGSERPNCSHGGGIGSAQILRVFANSMQCPWLCWTEEGGLWCDRPARDWIYDYNTSCTSRSRLGFRKNHPKAMRQTLLAAVLHDRIARNYYLNQFLPSRDAFLFLEYVYHRVSTLRYLAQLQALISPAMARQTLIKAEKDGMLTSLGEFADGSDWIKMFEALRSVVKTRPGMATKGRDRLGDLANAIFELRRKCFQGLVQNWTRTESYLRQVLPPDEIIAWCKNLLEYNLDAKSRRHREDRLAASGDSLKGVWGDTSSAQFKMLKRQDKDLGKQRDALIDAIKNTLFRAMYAHGSYAEILFSAGQAPKKSWSRWLFKDADEVCFTEWEGNATHWGLNRLVVGLWHTISHGVEPRKETRFKTIGMIESQLVTSSHGAMRLWPDQPEARLRAYYLVAEKRLGEHARKTRDVFRTEETRSKANTDFINRGRRDLEHIEDILTKAIEEAREEAKETSGSAEGIMRNPLLEPAADRGLFIPYRSLYQTLLGRCHLSKARFRINQARSRFEELVTNLRVAKGFARKPKAGSKTPLDELSEKRISRGLLEKARGALTEAYKDLAYAKNGIGQENSLIIAIADLACADVALTGSDLELCHSYLSDWNGGQNVINRSRAKLETASSYLTRCLERLLQGPRFVLIWRLYHQVQVSYHIRRIAIIMHEVAISQKRRQKSDPELITKKTGELVRRLRIGLTGLRFGLDYSPADSAKNHRDEFIELWAKLGAVALAAAVFLCDAAKTPSISIVAPSLLDILLAAWVDMNLSEGLFNWEKTFQTVDSTLAGNSGKDAVGSKSRDDELEPVTQQKGKDLLIGLFRESVDDFIRDIGRKHDQLLSMSDLLFYQNYIFEALTAKIADCVTPLPGKLRIVLR
jgi:SIR2-like domain